MNNPGKANLAGLLIAQFFGAFNDNAIKLLMALLAIRTLAGQLGEGTLQLEIASQAQTTLAFVVFTLPLMLFSLPAAWIADRFSKRSVLVATKGAEVLLMAAGTAALWLQPEGGVLGLIVLAAMGAQSALFSPAKYSILPEILPAKRLTAGNGVLELWTFLAIILGTAAGGMLLEQSGAQPWVAGAVLTGLALVGLVAIQFVPRVAPARPDASLVTACRDGFATIWRDRTLRLTVAGSVLFWGIASLVSQNALVYGRATLGLSESHAGQLLVASGVGIGIGSALVGRLSRSGLDLGWIPLGSIGLAAASAVLGLYAPGAWGTAAWLGALGVCSGLIVVPLNTALQLFSPAGVRGAVIAVANGAIFGGILAGSLGAQLFTMLGLTPAGIFTAAAVVVAAATAWALWLLPEACLRTALTLLSATLYRVRVRGAENVPAEGGGLLVANHMSFVDGLLLMASTHRPIRFLVYSDYYYHRWLHPFMRLLRAVPIAAGDSPRALLQSMRDAGKHLDDGELVCIFAEGEISRTGRMLPFQRGLERLVKGRDVPIVPLYLDRVWGSVFSFAAKRGGGGIPRLPRPVTVCFGAPMRADSDRRAVREAVRDLSADAWAERAANAAPLHVAFVRGARRAPWKLAAADATRPSVSRFGLLTAAVALARRLRSDWGNSERVGILLPPSVAGAATNIAAALAGRTAVNLNYTAGPAAIASAIRQAELDTIVTSARFLELAKIELQGGARLLMAEDLAASIGKGNKLFAALLAMFAPVRWLERACGAERKVEVDDVAAVLFSSGSTGEPKGVELTHFNLVANGDGTAESLPVSSGDRLLGILPLFHSFGKMSLWFALRRGMALVFHANPLDATAIGALIERYRVTTMLATPTFLQLYLRRCQPGQLGSIRLLITGAEKLPDRLATAFEQRFGIRPLEGYGATECSPVIAVGAPDYRAPGVFQAGQRPGSVGQPLPGITVRVVDPDSHAALPPGETGLLLVRGPNVMRGYLGRPDLTAQVLREGWYVTGDLAHVDDDGYVHIGDRLSRFSKIGGEMVPHGTVETALHEAAGRTEPTFAVTGVPDARKGEKLVVLHTLAAREIPTVLQDLGAAGLPNLFVPKADDFVQVEALPILGTGKLDLRAIKQIAIEHQPSEV